jgi:uncharacterized protein (TIGR03435 family)
MRRATMIPLFLAGLAFGPTIIGQTAETQSFTAADVHASKPGVTDGDIEFFPGGRVFARGATMLDLIRAAYSVEAEMVLGGPNWLDDHRFDINAKAPSTADEPAMRAMLQTLLADRFKLAIHKQEKAVPSYVLTVGKRGSKLKEPTEGAPADCDRKNGAGDIMVVCKNMTMVELGQALRMMARAYVDRPVVDLTGLKGGWDFTLSWTPKNQLRKPGEAERPGDQTTSTSLFDAVDKQLGLKLEPQEQPVLTIFIDRVNEKPTDNEPGITSRLPKEPTEFEAADVRVSAPGTKVYINFAPGGRLDAKAVTMKQLLNAAYGFDEDMIVGPKWLETERYDIVAKAPRDVSQEAMANMVRAMLAERFKLKVHNEDQPMPVYALIVGKRGLKMKESAGDVRANCKTSAGDGKRNYTCQNTTMAQLADKLRQQAPGYVNHPVVDKTGLTRAYDFVLSWTPKQAFQGGGRNADSPASPAAGSGPTASDPNGALTFTEAIDRQLGLKLEIQKLPMPVLVIDHAEQKPTEN